MTITQVGIYDGSGIGGGSVADVDSAGTVYAIGSPKSTVYASVDQGVTWQARGQWLSYRSISTMTITDQDDIMLVSVKTSCGTPSCDAAGACVAPCGACERCEASGCVPVPADEQAWQVYLRDSGRGGEGIGGEGHALAEDLVADGTVTLHAIEIVLNDRVVDASEDRALLFAGGDGGVDHFGHED